MNTGQIYHDIHVMNTETKEKVKDNVLIEFECINPQTGLMQPKPPYAVFVTLGGYLRFDGLTAPLTAADDIIENKVDDKKDNKTLTFKKGDK